MKYKQIDLKNGGKLFYVKNKINNSTLVEIAFDCGFASLSNFYRVFHKETGMVPLDYRKNFACIPHN